MSDALYTKFILDHNKHPRNFIEETEDFQYVDCYTPICGDHYRVYFSIDDNKIEKIYFSGEGCAISKASLSSLTEELNQLKTKDAITKLKDFFADMENKKSKHPLSDVKNYPARKGCVTGCRYKILDYLQNIV